MIEKFNGPKKKKQRGASVPLRQGLMEKVRITYGQTNPCKTAAKESKK